MTKQYLLQTYADHIYAFCKLRMFHQPLIVSQLVDRLRHILRHYRLETPRMRHFWLLHNEFGNMWHFGCDIVFFHILGLMEHITV